MALTLIDHLGLYNTVFTDTETENFPTADTSCWHRAYDQLLEIIRAPSTSNSAPNELSVLKRLLLRDPNEEYRAWLLCSLVPWARLPMAKQGTLKSKAPRSLAYLAIREGIKADNENSTLVNDAVLNLEDIIEHKDKGTGPIQPSDLPQKRKLDNIDMESRVMQGKAILRWGPRWRASVIFALLVQISEQQQSSKSYKSLSTSIYSIPGTDWSNILKDYTTWLQILEAHELLDLASEVESLRLKPLVDGHQLCLALNAAKGPWVKKALEMVIEWQLQHPTVKGPDKAIAEVVRRKSELGLG